MSVHPVTRKSNKICKDSLVQPIRASSWTCQPTPSHDDGWCFCPFYCVLVSSPAGKIHHSTLSSTMCNGPASDKASRSYRQPCTPTGVARSCFFLPILVILPRVCLILHWLREFISPCWIIRMFFLFFNCSCLFSFVFTCSTCFCFFILGFICLYLLYLFLLVSTCFYSFLLALAS